MKPDPLKLLKHRRRLDEAMQCQVSGRLEEARALYDTLLAESPDDADCRRGLGILCAQQGDFADGEVWLRKALDSDPSDARIWNDLGEILRRADRLDAARDAFQQALALNAEFPEALNNLGVASTLLGDYLGAADAFAQAIRLEPGYAHAHNNLGVLLERQEHWEEALRQYEEAVKLKPDFRDAIENYADLLKGHPDLIAASISRLAREVSER